MELTALNTNYLKTAGATPKFGSRQCSLRNSVVFCTLVSVVTFSGFATSVQASEPVKPAYSQTIIGESGVGQGVDSDNDGIVDDKDDFPDNPDETIDTDGDGVGNNADEDDDNDGQLDRHEITCGSDPLNDTSFSADYDGDNLPDCFDLDDDNDGVAEC